MRDNGREQGQGFRYVDVQHRVFERTGAAAHADAAGRAALHGGRRDGAALGAVVVGGVGFHSPAFGAFACSRISCTTLACAAPA